MIQRSLLATSLLLTAALPLPAATIVLYQFPAGANSATTTHAEAAVSLMAINNLGTEGADSGFSASAGNAFVRASVTPSTQSDAVTNNHSFSFTITPDAGFEFDLTQLTINVGNQVNSGSFTSNYFLRSSVDGFAADIPILSASGAGITFTGGIATRTTSTNGTTTGNLLTLDLSGALYQNLTAATTFRIYLFDASAATGAITRFDNVLVDGMVTAVPEPAAWVLGAFGAAMLIGRRRRG